MFKGYTATIETSVPDRVVVPSIQSHIGVAKMSQHTKRLTLYFECENDVFADDLANAAADALLATSKYIRMHGVCRPTDRGQIRDNNGNSIGMWEFK